MRRHNSGLAIVRSGPRRINQGGPMPDMALDFLAMTPATIDSRITFTRGSTGTYFNSSGVLSSAAINTPRFDYDPVTLAPKGLLIEEARTNLLLNSLLDGTSLSTQSVTLSATAYTLSFYGTGTVTLTGASTAGPLVGTGANNKVSLTFTPSAGSVTFTVSGSVKWANLEAGAFATSHIPTAGATVTRSADVATMTGTNFSSWYNQSAGTFVVRGDSATAVNSAVPSFAVASDGTNSNYMGIFADNSAGKPQFSNFVGGVSQGDLSPASFSIVANTPYAVASAYAVNDFALSANSGAVVTDTAGSLPVVTLLGIGSRHGNSRFLSGHIRQIAYFNTRLPNAQLQSLTA